MSLPASVPRLRPWQGPPLRLAGRVRLLRQLRPLLPLPGLHQRRPLPAGRHTPLVGVQEVATLPEVSGGRCSFDNIIKAVKLEYAANTSLTFTFSTLCLSDLLLLPSDCSSYNPKFEGDPSMALACGAHAVLLLALTSLALARTFVSALIGRRRG